jgi:hypothetical protein
MIETTILAHISGCNRRFHCKPVVGAALTTGYLLKPLCGESQQSFPGVRKLRVTMLYKISHTISRRAIPLISMVPAK